MEEPGLFPVISFFKVMLSMSQASWYLVWNFYPDYKENQAQAFNVIGKKTNPECAFLKVMQCCPENSTFWILGFFLVQDFS